MTQQAIRLLVVGGGGFIGQHIVDQAVMLGWQVTSLSLSPRHDVDRSARHVSADVTNAADLKDALGAAEFDYVVNCSGYIDHTPYFRSGQGVMDAHYHGTVHLVNTLDRNVLRAFINIGSSDEYGNAPAPQVETQREAPISPYSFAKVASTHFLQMLHRTEGFPAVTLRLFLTYGPGQNQKRFLPQIIQGCLEGRAFPTSSGEQLRDFCFVKDVVDAIFLAFDNPDVKGEVINIASGNPVSIRNMVETIVRLVGKGEPCFGEIAYRPGENMALYADISNARKLLLWEPETSLQDGLNMTIGHSRDVLQ